jgi:tRNA A37 N6-isopentenylltransferase MiaA
MWIDWLVKGMPDAPQATESVKAEVEALISGAVKGGTAAHKSGEEKKVEVAEEGGEEAVGTGAWDRARQELVRRSVEPADIQRAEALPRNDWYRLRRYLEVLYTRGLEGEGASSGGGGEDLPEGPAPPFRGVAGQRRPVLGGCDVRCFFISEDRAHLYRIIDERCTQVHTNRLLRLLLRLLLLLLLLLPYSHFVGTRRRCMRAS